MTKIESRQWIETQARERMAQTGEMYVAYLQVRSALECLADDLGLDVDFNSVPAHQVLFAQ